MVERAELLVKTLNISWIEEKVGGIVLCIDASDEKPIRLENRLRSFIIFFSLQRNG